MRQTNLPRVTQSHDRASGLETALALEAKRTIVAMVKAMRSEQAQENYSAVDGLLRRGSAQAGNPASHFPQAPDWAVFRSDLATESDRARHNSALYEPGRHLALISRSKTGHGS